MVVMLYIASTIAGFFLLIVSAHFVVYLSTQLAQKMNFSSIFVGMTIVAFGTSMPELVVSIVATMQGNQEIIFGNVIGSNIINILVIFGISSLIQPISVFRGKITILGEAFLCIALAVISLIVFNDIFLDKLDVYMISRSEALLLLGLFCFFLAYSMVYAKKTFNNERGFYDVNRYDYLPQKKYTGSVLFLLLLLSIHFFLLFIGGKISMYGIIGIANVLGISQRIIGVTIVAIGTSLPELLVSIIAAIKKNSDIALGNIVGSNAFNTLFILGVSGFIRPIILYSSINYDLFSQLGATILFFLILFFGEKGVLTRFKGGIFLFVYGLYLFYTIKIPFF